MNKTIIDLTEENLNKTVKKLKKDGYIPFKLYNNSSIVTRMFFKKNSIDTIEINGLPTICSELLKKCNLGVIDFDGRNNSKIPEKNVDGDYPFLEI